MSTKFKILAVAAALAAGTSSAAMAQYACAPGYAYINRVGYVFTEFPHTKADAADEYRRW